MKAHCSRLQYGLILLTLILPAYGDDAPSKPRTGVPAFEGAGPSKLRYRFDPGKSYSYAIRIEAEVGDTINSVTAGVTYFPRPAAKPTKPKEERKPTATAFAVHTDGYLMTCAHVVEDAQQVEVAIGGKSFPAKVLSVDAALDLALLKIEAKGLPPLALTDSETAEVGQEVRAFGYPLSSILGDSLKATRGTVAGIDKQDGNKFFQVDVSINPGNSGGPLVNEQGQVVGVVNAKLAGDTISNVGFAVPVNYAKKMLGEKDVKFAAAKGGDKLEGPALVKKVSPAVALVTVTVKPGAGEELYTLRVSNHMTQSERPKPGAGIRIGGPPRIGPPRIGLPGFGREIEMKVDSNGNVEELSGGESLPYMMGNLPLLVFDPLPGDSRTKWEVKSQTTIREKSENRNDFMFGRRTMPRGPFGPGGPGGPRFGNPFGQQEEDEGTKYDAVEKTVYTIEETKDDLVTINKEYELKTQEAEGKTPYLQMTGSGKITFDAKAGVPKKLDYKGAITVTRSNVSVKIPLTVSYELGEPKPADPNVAAKPADPNAPAQPPQPGVVPAARPEPKELTDEEINTVIADLQADAGRRQRALGRLREAKVTEGRKRDVAATIDILLSDADWRMQQGAAVTLRTWGTTDNVPALLPLATHNNVFLRRDAIATLGALKDPRAVDAIAERLLELGDRATASQALRSIGPACEPALLKVVKQADGFTKWEICQLLGDLGTQDSLPLLKEFAQGSDFGVKVRAEAALKVLESRLKAEPVANEPKEP